MRNWKYKSGGTSELGMTLVELMAVMLVMTFLLGMAGFGLSKFHRANILEGAAETLVTDLRDAQIRSQSEVRTYQVQFDSSKSSYDVYMVLGPLPTDIQLVDSVSLDTSVLMAEIGFEGTSGCSDPNPLNVIYFCPRGISSSGKVVLSHLSLNQDREVLVTGLTARVELK